MILFGFIKLVSTYKFLDSAYRSALSRRINFAHIVTMPKLVSHNNMCAASRRSIACTWKHVVMNTSNATLAHSYNTEPALSANVLAHNTGGIQGRSRRATLGPCINGTNHCFASSAASRPFRNTNILQRSILAGPKANKGVRTYVATFET